MISQSPPLDVPAVVPPSPATWRGHPGPEGVTIGSLALPAQDTTILRALVRLLDGALGMGLRYSEDVAGCHVVFASPAALSTCPGRTTVVVTDAATVPLGWGGPITISSPLRMIGVITALQQALPRRRSSNPLDRQRWLSSLFERLRAALRSCGHSVLPIGGGQLLRLDAVSQSMQATVPVEQLLSHAHDLGALRPCTAADEDALQGAETHSLSVFLWRLSATMVEARAPHPPLRGAWRLRRWPQAMGLMAPGHPHLAALLWRRPYTALELAERAGLPLPVVRAFVLTGDALGLGQLEEATHPLDVAREAAAWGRFKPLREKWRLW